MPFDLSLPLSASALLACGLVAAVLAAFTYFGLPHVRVRTYNKTHGGLRVAEVAFILSRPAALPRPKGARAAAEFVIYMTLKTGNLG